MSENLSFNNKPVENKPDENKKDENMPNKNKGDSIGNDNNEKRSSHVFEFVTSGFEGTNRSMERLRELVEFEERLKNDNRIKYLKGKENKDLAEEAELKALEELGDTRYAFLKSEETKRELTSKEKIELNNIKNNTDW